MREVVTPIYRKAMPKPDDVQKQVEEAKARAAEYRQKVTDDLKVALDLLPERDRQIIRQRVALSLPDKPMTADELQLWLDERTLGVARYMMTGKIT